jgi:hypothetical protein
MKKFLLTFTTAFVALAFQADAQVIMTENFDGPSGGALPSGWSQVSSGTPGWKTAMFAAPITTGWGSATGTTSPAHSTQICLVDDWNDSTTSNLNNRLVSSTFSLTGSTSAWLNYSYYFFNATRTSTGNTETCIVKGSTDGGSTWTNLDTLEGWAFNEVWHRGHTSLAALGTTSTNVKIAFEYSDDADHLLGCALDSVEVINLTATQAAATAIGYNDINIGISANGQSVAFLAQNTGVPITSIKAQYTINGGAPVVETFSSLSLASYASQAFTFTTPMAGAIAGLNTLKVSIVEVNGAPNTEVDSTENSSFTLASAVTNRQGFIEEFSSSTCPPCKSFNDMYDPLCISLNVNTTGTDINVIKYQMNWPSPGTDRSYNTDGASRRTYYGVSGIPDHFVNGRPSTATDYAAEATGSKALKAFIDMSITYTVDTVRKKLGTIVRVTPRFTKTGSFHVYTAVMDKYYENTNNTTGQLKYYHVMRQMLPTGAGRVVTSWTDGVAQSFVDTGVTYTNTSYTLGSTSYPTQNSFKFWNNPFTGSEVIAWVQDDATKSVLQSVWSVPAGSLNVSTMAKIEGISIFPNPTKGESNLKFDLQEEGNVRITVMDYTGKVVSEVANGHMTTGVKNVKIVTNNIAAGNYIVVLSTESGNRAERLTVE